MSSAHRHSPSGSPRPMSSDLGASASAPARAASADVVRTSYIVSNLHCPTCVSAITNELNATFARQIRWVSPNIVTSVVTVEHDPDVSIKAMADVLTDAGYEVSGVSSSGLGHEDLSSQMDTHHATQADAPAAPSSSFKAISHLFSAARRTDDQVASAHVQNCEQCHTLGDHPHPDRLADVASADSQSPDRGTESSRSTASNFYQDPTAAKIPQMSSSVSPLTSDAGEDDVGKWRATVSVEGMTCASCVNTVTEALNEGSYTNVTVNLVSNSATIDYRSDRPNSIADQIVDEIEEKGYGATLVKVDRLEEKLASSNRTIEVALEGMYCQQCPARIVKSLKGFRRNISIITEPTTTRPILKFSYVPDAPDFTIRQIVAAIQASDKSLKASIYHPPSLEERSRMAQRKHQRALLFRAAVTFILAIPTFVIGIVYMSLVPDPDATKDYLMMPWVSGITRGQIALFALATPVYFLTADVFHRRAIKEISNLWRRGSRVPILRRFYRFGSMNTLMSLGTTIAYVSSIGQLIAAGVHHPRRIADDEFYFDSVVFLTLFLLVGRWIEAYSKAKTGDAVTALGKLRPTEAILVERTAAGTASDIEVEADLLEFGDVIRVRNGASPPADAVVVEGQTNFDESSLTGEARLILKKPEDTIYAGTVNKGDPITARITGAAGTSMLDQIVAVVREGQTKRAPMEQYADVLTTYFVPVVTLIAILTWLIWMILGLSGAIPTSYLDVTSGGWVAFALQFAISVFVVACPCGLGLAAPTAIFVGGGLAAQHGILAKGGGEAFQKASAIDCVVFDKTGTLTEGGQPTVTDHHFFPDGMKQGFSEPTVLHFLKEVEGVTSHPIAKALVAFCKDQNLENHGYINMDLAEIHETPGKGMDASTGGAASFGLLVGNEALIAAHDCKVPKEALKMMQQWKSEAKSVALVAARRGESQDDKLYHLAAVFAISDAIRPEAAAVVRSLLSRGTQVWMLSGDNDVTAKAVATLVNIHPSNVISGVLPTEKAAQIQRLQSTLKAGEGSSNEAGANYKRAIVAMIGDGINDSPALTQADVGIAIGSGSDVAISSAEFVLVKSDLWSIVTLLDLSHAVFRRVKVNFGWALVYNVLAVPIAAGVLMPIVSNGRHVRLDPVWASLAMALSSISVVLSSLALRSGIPGVGFRASRGT